VVKGKEGQMTRRATVTQAELARAKIGGEE
jgi:hypothetical protein